MWRREKRDSVASSIEFQDNIIDATWFRPGAPQSYVPTGLPTTSKKGDFVDDRFADSGIIERLWRWWSDKELITRISKYEQQELKTFVAQKLFKVDGILCDEQARCLLIEKLMTNPECVSEEEQYGELMRKHGPRMVSWLRDRLVPSVGCWDELISLATQDYNEFRAEDPLCNWYRSSPEISTRIVRRIHLLVENMYQKVKWSFLVEPGKFTCHLSEFVAEFNRLDVFLHNNELTPEEADQTTFLKNHLTKARNQMLSCVELTRVKLRPLRDSSGAICLDDPRFRRSRLVDDLFHSEHVPEVATDDQAYGTSDFIHANYVEGGPLKNKFICTQAPMKNTQQDFWRMVYQERCGLIVMLCAAVDTSTLGALHELKTEYCPYYWPRTENSELTFGNLIVRNVGVDSAKDPLFNVTYLEVYRKDDVRREEAVRVEHWQYDWNNFMDLHWPFRILRRARMSPSPTLVHCMDGAGRTGVLVTLETVFMQFLTGSPLDDDVVMMSAVFVRLQRRGAIANALQYLYVFRCLLHWMSPFVTGWRHRLALGLTYKSVGFITKWEAYLKDHAPFTVPY